LFLQLSHVRKAFNGTVAVDDLSLEARAGEILGLLGPNGAGKTTTVSLAIGLLSPDAGTVELEGVGPPSDPAVRAKLGVAPQALAIYDELTGEENLRFFGQLQGLRGPRLGERVDWALDFVGLTDRRKTRVRTWSGGMQRRLNLAAALVHDPPVLLFDEPTVGVDPQSRNAILDRIKELRDQGRAVVYTTHYMEEAERLCDRVAIIDHGRLLALDTVDGLVTTHGGPSVVELETAAGRRRVETTDPLAELERAQHEGGLRNFHVHRADLEMVFLHLTGRSLRD
jgi:ABC-2 type transport system ATP-binding protein